MRRFLLFVLFMIAYTSALKAQSGEIVLGIKGGNYSLFGSFGAISVEAKYSAKNYFAVRGGVQYNSIGRTATEIRPQYFHDFNFGRLSGEVLFNYAYQSRMNSYVVGFGANLDIPYIWTTIGYYHRTLTMSSDKIAEPFNIYYEFGVRCLPKQKQWDLNLLLSNCRIFELERHYQPTWAAECWWYPNNKCGVQVGVNYKPAGIFNISSEYYSIYANIGVCYKW